MKIAACSVDRTMRPARKKSSVFSEFDTSRFVVCWRYTNCAHAHRYGQIHQQLPLVDAQGSGERPVLRIARNGETRQDARYFPEEA